MEEFKIKALEQRQEEKELEITTWEDEGGAIEAREEIPAEVLETVLEEAQVEKSWQEILTQARSEFPEDIQRIINKDAQGRKLSLREYNNLDHFAQLWFREIFGMRIKKKITTLGSSEEIKKPLTKDAPAAKLEKRSKKKQDQLEYLGDLKKDQMERLHRALRNLDNGELVEEFIDETRRVVYFDEKNQWYFLEKNGIRINIGIGDIVSDYAWDIKYIPDSGMIEPTAYRTLAKRILTNETRRNLEKIHNYELARHAGFTFTKFKERFLAANEHEKESLLGEIGFIAEIIVRELLSRIGQNHNLDFAVSRVTIEEDREFKYDFKIQAKRRIRGIDVDGRSPNKSLGFDLKTRRRQKEVQIDRTKKGVRLEVDEIFILKVPGKDINNAFQQWFKAGELSGGPEQFLSPELKRSILKNVTKNLTEIPQEVFDKIS